MPTQKGMLPKTPTGSFSLFYPVTVKMLMCDPINHYIYLPLCYVFTQVSGRVDRQPGAAGNPRRSETDMPQFASSRGTRFRCGRGHGSRRERAVSAEACAP